MFVHGLIKITLKHLLSEVQQTVYPSEIVLIAQAMAQCLCCIAYILLLCDHSAGKSISGTCLQTDGQRQCQSCRYTSVHFGFSYVLIHCCKRSVHRALGNGVVHCLGIDSTQQPCVVTPARAAGRGERGEGRGGRGGKQQLFRLWTLGKQFLEGDQ